MKKIKIILIVIPIFLILFWSYVSSSGIVSGFATVNEKYENNGSYYIVLLPIEELEYKFNVKTTKKQWESIEVNARYGYVIKYNNFTKTKFLSEYNKIQ